MTPEDTIAAVTPARLDLLKVVDFHPITTPPFLSVRILIGAFERERNKLSQGNQDHRPAVKAYNTGRRERVAY